MTVTKPRVLMVHNYYQSPGGEDVVFRAESDLLRQHGHHLAEYTDNNERISQARQVSLALQTIWSWETHSMLRKVILKERPNIVHFHNTFPLISPAAYYACKASEISVVQTLHNFRLTCPAATLYRAGAVCEKCLGKIFPWPGIRYRCYHDSALHTGILAGSIFTHHLLRTWQTKVDAFIALTEFSKAKFLEAGIPEKKVYVKPNFLPEPRSLIDAALRKDFVMYAGRWVPEKGVATLQKAWRKINIPIYIFGNSPQRGIEESGNLRFMNYVDRNIVFSYMAQAKALIFPSEWYEGFPMTLIEAFANSLPVITSNIGSQAEIVKDGYSGLHFRSGDADDLAAKVQWLLRNPQEQLRMGHNARVEYEQKYMPERNYEMLMDIYSRALENSKKL